MGQTLSWILAALFLAGGGAILARSAREYAADRLVARRFRQFVLPQTVVPWAALQGAGALEWLGRRITGAEPVRKLQTLLVQAGFMQPAAPFIFAGIRLVLTLGAIGTGLFWSVARHGALTPASAGWALFGGVFVYRSCSIVLKLRMEGRQRQIRRELPYVLDLVLMVLDSGVSIDQTLQHVSVQIGRVAPISATMLRRYIADTEDGMPYDMALDRLALRLSINEGRDFAGLLKQNLFQGGELTPPLQRLSTDIAETRLATAREQMGKKSVLLTLIMLAFFMPVLMIALAGPAVSDVITTLSRVAHDMHNSKVHIK